MAIPYVGDIGTRFDYIIRKNGSVLNLTGYTTGQITLTYQKADGTNVSVFPSTIVSAAAGQVRYTVSSTTFLTVPGQWIVQGFVQIDANNKFHSDPSTFMVGSTL
jgi:hypothetical protein